MKNLFMIESKYKKNLTDVELNYIKDIIEYFCSLGMKLILQNPIYSIDRVRDLINKGIENRLFNTNIIIDYKIELNFYSKDEKRDYKISNLLEDKNNPSEDNIKILYRYKNGEFYEYEYKI